MKSRNLLLSAVLFPALLGFTAAASAASQKVFSSVYSFPPGIDGSLPNGKLLSQGLKLYGTTFSGGSANVGTIFELAPSSGGQSVETVLYSFTGAADGANPTAGLIADSAGALYGTAENGGSGNGVVFQLAPPARGSSNWTYNVIYAFGSMPDGANPNCDLVFDSNNNLYGTTVNGGASGDGTVFQLSPPSGGVPTWAEHVLLSFDGTDGAMPFSSIVVDSAGDLFGTTSAGGTHHYGTVFELAPPSSPGGNYAHAVIYEFTGGADGRYPLAGVLISATGVIYGTTYGGGTGSGGVAYMLTRPTTGILYTESTIFAFDITNGANPSDVLTPDARGNLYGTTGGAAAGTAGTVFELTPSTAGQPYNLNQIYAFTGGVDGQAPLASLITTPSGTLYGTTFYGGQYGNGTVFQLK